MQRFASPLIAVALSTSLTSALPAQSVERIVVQESVAFDNDLAAPFVTPNGTLALGSAASVDAELYPPLLPLGVDFLAARVDGSIDRVLELTVRDLGGGGTIVRATVQVNQGACGGGCTWGFLDPQGQAFDIGNGPSSPLSPGEVRTFSAPYSFSFGGDFGPSLPFWDAVSAFPSVSVSANASLSDLIAIDGTIEVPVELTGAVSSVEARLRIESTFRLSQAPSAVYCSSPANSSGGTATLEAFGSIEAGSEWLTVAGSGFPDGAAGVLFAGTAFASTPSGSVNLCVGGQVRRLGGVQFATGDWMQFDIDLVGISAGESVYLQAFHRDPLLSIAASNGTLVLAQ